MGLELKSGSASYRIAVHQSDLANEIHFDSSVANVNLPPTNARGSTSKGNGCS